MNNFTSIKLCCLAMLLFIFTGAGATILRVNNTLATDKTKNIFASLQEAHDAAAGTGTDTLLVEGSTTEYALLNCTKKLVIIGPGYFLLQNGGQANALSATVQSINFKAGSEGSTIIGLTFSTLNSSYAPYVYVNGIAILRCSMTNGIGIFGNITSLVILQNYMPGGIGLANSAISFSGVILKNNLIGSISISTTVSVPRIFATVEHNIFTSGVTLSTNTFQSNIITYQFAGVNITSNIIQYNLDATNKTVSISSTNQLVQSNQLFIGLTAANNSPDGQYQFVTNSAYNKAGLNGEQPGIFGGSEPYVLSGIPPIPTIYQLQSDAVANKQDGLNVTIKARANQ